MLSRSNTFLSNRLICSVANFVCMNEMSAGLTFCQITTWNAPIGDGTFDALVIGHYPICIGPMHLGIAANAILARRKLNHDNSTCLWRCRCSAPAELTDAIHSRWTKICQLSFLCKPAQISLWALLCNSIQWTRSQRLILYFTNLMVASKYAKSTLIMFAYDLWRFFLSVWLIDWLIDWLIEWRTDWFIHSLIRRH